MCALSTKMGNATRVLKRIKKYVLTFKTDYTVKWKCLIDTSSKSSPLVTIEIVTPHRLIIPACCQGRVFVTLATPYFADNRLWAEP